MACQKRTLAVDSDMIDLAIDELSILMLRLDKNPKKTRKEQNTIKKIQEIRDTIQILSSMEIEKEQSQNNFVGKPGYTGRRSLSGPCSTDL